MLGVRRILAALLLAGGGHAVAEAQCDLLGPATIDHGMLQHFTIRCDHAFVGFLQVSVDPSFSPSLRFPIRASQQSGSDHVLVTSIRVPWDIQSLGVSDFHLRGIVLDGNGQIHVAGPEQIPVGMGDRVYLNADTSGKNLFVIEQESEEPTEDWNEITANDGYTGPGYIKWLGNDHFNDDSHGRIVYRFKVETAGSYALAFRSGHWGGHLHNDCWCAWDDGHFEKVFCGDEGFWSWKTQLDDGSGFRADLDVGVHTLTFSARSKNFNLDRFHIYNRSDFPRPDIEDETIAHSAHEYQ